MSWPRDVFVRRGERRRGIGATGVAIWEAGMFGVWVGVKFLQGYMMWGFGYYLD